MLDREAFRGYSADFDTIPTAGTDSFIHDGQSWEWMKQNIPFLSCPDREVERTWYYRWWVFRKHIRHTPSGFIVTEFLRPVNHASDHNAISCALGHHVAEGRWLRDPRFIDDYLRFWLHGGEGGGLQRHYHQFSNWTAAAVRDRLHSDGRKAAALGLLNALILDYETWEKERILPDGLFWQYDVRDGMEESISGGRNAKNARPSINSYMYGNAQAIAEIAQLDGRWDVVKRFGDKAAALKRQVESRLWNAERQFFVTRMESGAQASVREAIGFTPWMFGLPSRRRGFENAWKQLMDPDGFYAPFGPTTAERRHPGFAIAESGDDCQWNGPSWPFATTVTLKALANLLQRDRPDLVSADDYFRVFLIYARSHRLTLPDGRQVAFIDENLNPLTGEWHARSRKIKKGTFYGRGDHYNHSGFADLVITGLAGLRPRSDNTVDVRPLLPEGAWDWFCLEGIPYHGRSLTILWDRTGTKFNRGKGMRVFVDGRLAAHSARLGPLRAKLH